MLSPLEMGADSGDSAQGHGGRWLEGWAVASSGQEERPDLCGWAAPGRHELIIMGGVLAGAGLEQLKGRSWRLEAAFL